MLMFSVMLLLKHKQCLQSYDAQSSVQREIFSFKAAGRAAGKHYNELLLGLVTSLTLKFT